MKVFSISAIKDGDTDPTDGLLVAECDQQPPGYSESDIFWYGLSESAIQAAIESGEPVGNFVITDYELVDQSEESPANIIQGLLQDRYTNSEVTSGEFINGQILPVYVFGMKITRLSVGTGIQQFLDWDESPAEFEIERSGQVWLVTA